MWGCKDQLAISNDQLSMLENNGHFIDHWVLTIDH
jgi:hypothetical protein